MNKFNLFIEKYAVKIILVLMLLTLMKSCSIDSELTVVKKELRKEQQVINNLPTKIDVQIEGLKSEKRMIQGTDRKMLDVQRQNQIEKEIKALSAIK
jgi:thiamine biosynthesis lipoprotein ApbE